MRKGPGVDKIENVQKLTFPANSVGSCLMLDTLEHVENPFEATAEIHRVLQLGGILIMTSVMQFPIHDYPSDYWRFTPQAFKLLLSKFDYNLVGYQGDPRFPHTIIGIGAKAPFDTEKFLKLKAANRETVYI